MAKRKSAGQAPSRKSARIANLQPNLQPEDEGQDAASPSTQPSVQTGISALSTAAESSTSREHKVQETRDRVNRYVPGQRLNDDKLIGCINAFLDWLPEEGIDTVIHGVADCGDSDEKLFQFFGNLAYGLLYPLKTVTAKTSVIESPVDKRQTNAELVATTLSDPQSRTSQFRELCIRRDDYRCVITKQMDFVHWEKLNEPADIMAGDLEAAHIIPFSLASWRDNTEETHEAASIWESLFRCFPSLRRSGMCAGNINDPFNGIILRDSMHKLFGNFRCALQPTDTADVYSIKTYQRFPQEQRTYLPSDRKVTIQRGPDGEGIRLPSRHLLDCHWRIAEILHASGMGVFIDRINREWEDIKEGEGHGCLREDGGSNVSKFLNVAFWTGVAG